MNYLRTFFTLSYESNIWKMYLFKFFMHMHFIAAVLVPFFTEWGKVSFSRVLILNSAFMMFIFLLEIPTGTVADFFGRKISLILSCIACIISTLVYVSHPNFYVFLFAEFIWAIAATLMSGADEAFIYDSLKKLDREKLSKKIYSSLQSFQLTGMILAAFLGSFIAKAWGLRAPFIAMIIPMGLACIIAMTLTEPEIDKDEGDEKEEKAYSEILLSGLKYFSENKVLKILTFDMVLVGSMSWLIIWSYQKILLELGMDIIYFGVIHASMCIAQIFIIQGFPTLEKLFKNKKNVLLMGAIVPGICFITLGTVKSIPIVIIATVMTAGFGLSRKPLFSSYLNKFIPSDKRATVLSVTSMFRTFSIAICNIIGAVISKWWSVSYMLIFFGVLLLIFPLFTRVKEEHLID